MRVLAGVTIYLELPTGEKKRKSAVDIQLEQEIDTCMHCKKKSCKFGYCDEVGTLWQRKKYLASREGGKLT